MRDKAHQALAAVHSTSLPPLPGAAHGVKQEEMEDDFVVFAGRSRVFRPGTSTAPTTPQTVPMPQGPTLPHDEPALHGVVGESMIGEWLARQEEYVGDDPHYVAAIESPPSAPHDQHHPQQHQQQQQQRQYGYAPAQPQYTLEAAPPPPHYMTAPYAAYAPPPHPPPQLLQHPHAPRPHDLHPSTSHAPEMGHLPHELHRDEMADIRRDYAVTARGAELAQLGFAANGSRMNETWLSFMQ